jgi:hypothetical protein
VGNSIVHFILPGIAHGDYPVHFQEGWFVVGGGRNGMEYSVLLMLCFTATGIAYWEKNLTS